MLRIFEAIEEEMSDRRYVPARPNRFKISSVPTDPREIQSLAADRMVRQTFNLSVTASVTSPDEGPAMAESRQKVAQMIGRYLYAELREEMVDLLHWSYGQGLGRDLEKRLGRMIKLAEGKSPPPIKD